MDKFDVIIIGSGPAGLGAAFELIENKPNLKIAIIEKDSICSGGLRNDCKQNYTYPIGFPTQYWTKNQVEKYFKKIKKILKPKIKRKKDLNKYHKRIEHTGKDIRLINVSQAHVGTDQAKILIESLYQRLKQKSVKFFFQHEMTQLDFLNKNIVVTNLLNKENIRLDYDKLIMAVGRKSFEFLQKIMTRLNIKYVDNIIDIGVRVELHKHNYSIVDDFYDPKIYFPDNVRTFCTNSGFALVVRDGQYSVNGHALSSKQGSNGLVNFALLKTIQLTSPISSGHDFAQIIGKKVYEISAGKLIMQRVGDFRCQKRSLTETFNDTDLGYDFKNTYQANPGDIALGELKIILPIWRAMKALDKIVPGILHPSTIMYYPEIKTYANKPVFKDRNFQVSKDIYMIGDGAGTSRGITAAWASGIRSAESIVNL